MKPSKKRYQVNTTEAIEFWNKMFSRMEILLKLIDACKPNRSIDDSEYRWVEDRIEYWGKPEPETAEVVIEDTSNEEIKKQMLQWATGRG